MDDVEPVKDEEITFHGDTLSLNLAAGETAYVRRSSLIFADGEFQLATKRIAKRRFGLISFFTGQVRWSNIYTAGETGLKLIAGRDFIGTVACLEVRPEAPVHIKPGLYLAHQGDLTFNTRRVAKKEFWVLNEVSGTGRVYIKMPGRPLPRPMTQHASIVDSNYVAAISGTFEAHGKVFKAKDVLKSGELENVKLKGDGTLLFQSENPSDRGSGGGIFQTIIDILPF